MQIKIIILGLIQGLTEFLPVSSSGHLALMQIFGGVGDMPVAYDIVLHCATMLATFIFFGYDIYYLAMEWFCGFASQTARTKEGWPTGWAVIFATVITAAIGIGMRSVLETVMQNSLFVGLGLMITGVVLVCACFIQPGYGHIRPVDGISVGLAQGIATLPGISRSGMTIVTGCLVGLSREDAFRLSFLISIPAILGATILEAVELGGFSNFVAELPSGWFGGATAAFVSGLCALYVLKKVVISAKWWLFGIYCLLVGTASVVISFVGV